MFWVCLELFGIFIECQMLSWLAPVYLILHISRYHTFGRLCAWNPNSTRPALPWNPCRQPWIIHGDWSKAAAAAAAITSKQTDRFCAEKNCNNPYQRVVWSLVMAAFEGRSMVVLSPFGWSSSCSTACLFSTTSIRRPKPDVTNRRRPWATPQPPSTDLFTCFGTFSTGMRHLGSADWNFCN